MHIPFDYGQVNWKFEGVALPTGAEVTCGFWHHNFPGTVADCAEALYGVWLDNILPHQSSSLTLVSALVKYGPNEDGAAFEFFDSTPGGGSSEMAPPNLGLLVTKVTIVGGRKGRGRMFIPGLTEGDVNPGGSINGATVTAWSDDLENMRDDMTGLNLPARLLHGVYDPQPAPYSIEQFAVSSTAATQRRRLRR